MILLTIYREWFWLPAIATGVIAFGFWFCWFDHDDNYSEFDKHFKGRMALVWFALTVVLFVVGFWFDAAPFKSDYEKVQDKVNACLKAGGHPIVTDAGTRSETYPRYWGCDK
jgi:hypothetical protein